jgi:hypothetical protein
MPGNAGFLGFYYFGFYLRFFTRHCFSWKLMYSLKNSLISSSITKLATFWIDLREG